ncbi:MAG: DUF177 domain-containing protein, partial [Candidatus Omnitrophica bacterium]|nr:DUF177 domain-containing protein [Candidatus Omnitrophota bacterium]
VPKPLEATYDARELDLEFVDLHYLKKILLEGVAERIKQTVTFRGTLRSRVEQVCARCLEPRESDVMAPFDLSYDIKGQETIDTTDDLRDILILLHPDRFLCKPECRGICAYCGANLNRETCQCEKKTNESVSWKPLKEEFKKRES